MTIKSAVIDEIDRDILRLLERDGRASYRQISEAIGLSANAAAERVRRLLADGIVRVRAEPDRALLGDRLSAYIDVRLEYGIGADAFEQQLAAIAGIVAAAVTTGAYDFVLTAACADEAALVEIIEAVRRCGARETQSRVVLRERRFTALPAAAKRR